MTSGSLHAVEVPAGDGETSPGDEDEEDAAAVADAAAAARTKDGRCMQGKAGAGCVEEGMI
jgi:hypothetical protein